MRNPFRSENAAFHFLLLTVAAFALVAAASAAGGADAALVVWVVVSAVAVALYAHGRERREPEIVPRAGPAGERRIVVVAPLLASPLHRLASDVDAEEAEARARAAEVVRSLSAPHVHVSSAVGEDPVAAVDDAHVARLRERYAVPVTQLD